MSRRAYQGNSGTTGALFGLLGLFGAVACSSSSSANAAGCNAAALTCGQILPASVLAQTLPHVTGYTESAHSKCTFKNGVYTVFCGNEKLLAIQLAHAQKAFPGMVTETPTTGKRSFEVIVGVPKARGSFAEVAALTSNGKYVFGVSLASDAADIADVRTLAVSIDQNLSRL